MKSGRPPFSAFHPERYRRIPERKPGGPNHDAADACDGCVSIGGTFAVDHHDEIIDMIRRFEKSENAAHPHKRIVSIRTNGDTLLIDTNDVRLARAIGDALCVAYQGELKFHFGEPDCLVRVHWER